MNVYFCPALHPKPLHIRICAGLVLLAFFLQSFSRTWVVADYWLNTGYYAAHCENKARPEMHCNGKCQMMKNIKAEERKDAENQERLSEKFENGPLSSKHFLAEIHAPVQLMTSAKHAPFMVAAPCSGHTSGLLRPPAAA